MSCWRNYTCDVLKDVDKNIMEEALKNKGVTLDYTNRIVKSYYEDRSENVDATFIKDGHSIDLGIIFDDETHHAKIVGDFWNTGLNDATFTDELSREYQRINLVARLEHLGYTVDEETVTENADGSIEMEAYAFA